MATNHTPNFGLCQWEATDAVLREDFNADNLALEEALLNAHKGPSCVIGSYVGGTDPDKVTVELGFRPSFLVILADYSKVPSFLTSVQNLLFAFGDHYAVLTYDTPTRVYAGSLLTDTGFCITASSERTTMNADGITFHYAAFY